MTDHGIARKSFPWRDASVANTMAQVEGDVEKGETHGKAWRDGGADQAL
jgi:hypothetical protein